MIPSEILIQIQRFIEQEAGRVEFGHLFIDITMMKGQATNIQCETKRSMNINQAEGRR